MDSISHALYRAIMADDAHQRKLEMTDKPTMLPEEAKAGLQQLATRQGVHEAFAGAAGTDLHIDLERGTETLCLYFEFVAAGLCPPASLVDGASVILSPGRVDVMCPTDNAEHTWTATLAVLDPDAHRTNRKAGWTEQLC